MVCNLRLLLFLAVLVSGCSRLDPPGPQQPLIVGLATDPVFQQESPSHEGMDGFSRDLAKLFAKSLQVETRFVIAPDYPALLEMVRKKKVHFAAALPVLKGETDLRYTPAIQESQQLVVQHASAFPLDRPDKLAGQQIAVMAGGPQAMALRTLGLNPPPEVQASDAPDELEMLANVARRRHALAATDELHFTVAANFHPDLSVATYLPEKLAYVWAFHADHQDVYARATDFIGTIKDDGTLRRLNDRYFGHIRRLDTRGIQGFLAHTRERLSEFRHHFHEAQEITGIDWRLIAALAYQESKWDPLATSPTGVRGMMMLTEDTADRLKVSNRLDARESIIAGAKYLAFLMDELPDEVKQPDRLWFALAAYNLGMGHLNGARHFAPGLNRDPNLWVDMKQVMPLMAKPEYYTRLKSGRARGGEAVIMTENIRSYYDVLSRLERTYTPPSMTTELPKKKIQRKPKPKKNTTQKPSAGRT